MKYAHIENKILKAWYDETDNIPSENIIEISDEDYFKYSSMNINYYENGEFTFKDLTTDEEKEQAKINSYKSYLTQTDWVEHYYIKHLAEIQIISEDSTKWDIINKRKEYKEYLNEEN